MKKRLWSILLVACMVLTLLPFGALAAADNQVVWSLSGNDTVLMIKFNGDMPDYDDEDAKTPWLAYKSTVTTLIVEENPEWEDSADRIGDNAFKNFTALTSVTLPDNLTVIGESAFAGCKKLESVSIPKTVKTIEANAFSGCTKLAKVTFEGTDITTIAKNAFKDTAVADVYYAGTAADWDEVNVNGTGNDKLTKADLHTICEPGKHKFKTEKDMDATCTEEGYTGDQVCKVCGYTVKGTSIPKIPHKWGDWSVKTKVTATSDGVEERTCKAVKGSYHTQSVKVPAGTTYTPAKTADVFDEADKITVTNTRANIYWLVWIAAGLPEASAEATNPFTDVSASDACYNAVVWGVEQGIIPVDSTKKFNPSEQMNRKDIFSLVDPDSEEYPLYWDSIPHNVTYNAKDSVWEVPEPTSVYDNDFSYVISTDGKTAYVEAYRGTAKEVTIPEKIQGAVITGIGNDAFNTEHHTDYNTAITKVTIPNTVTSIGDSAFINCTKLESISFPTALKTIGAYAFYNCDSLTNVVVPEGVTSIGEYAFADCDKLASITLPKSLKTLGTNALTADPALKDIFYQSGQQDWRELEYYGYNSEKTTVHFAEDASPLRWVVEDGKAIVIDCLETAAGDLVIPDTLDGAPVTEIRYNAFYGCNKLTSVTIPEGVTTIGSYAFNNCTSLTSVTLPKSLNMVEGYAFDGTRVKDVYYGGTVEDWNEVILKTGNDVLKAVKVGEGLHPTCVEHKTELQNVVEATCTEKGYSGDQVCTVCGQTIEKGKEVEALGHDWGEWTVTKEPTATEKGEQTRVCKRDTSHVEKQDVEPTGKPDEPEKPEVKPVNFIDVPTDAYFAPAVSWAVNHKPVVTTGTDALHFSPYDNCTRGQMVTFLWRAAGEPEPTTTQNPFTDVNSSEYFYKAVLWAVEQNITTGTSLTTFSPYDTVTRAQTVTFLWRMAKQPVVVAANPFTDVPTGEYYTNAVLWAVQQGITTGTSTTTFSPNDPCTRAQIVTFLYRDLGQTK